MTAEQQRNKAIATLAAKRAGINPRIFDNQMGDEANFQDERSPAGAIGPAQFMPATARSVGLRNPHDPQQAYTAAAHLMAGYLHQYGGSWSKALQAYNAGPGSVGKPLYAETRAYINKILGGPDIVDHPPGGAGTTAGGGGVPNVTPVTGSLSLTQDDPALERRKFFAQWFAQHNPTSPLVKLGVLDPNMDTHAQSKLPYIKGFDVAPGAPGAGAAHSGPHTVSTVSTQGGMIAHFEATPVASWIAPILKYARAHGWQGTVTSGYRTLAEQKHIYDSGTRPAAKPGTSNHEFTAFPGGAVDVSEAAQLSSILRASPYADKLVWAGSKDPVHFSHPHGGSY